MLGQKYFYFQLIRKYVAIFGSVFNNIIIQRTDAEGNLTQQINVPITYIEKDKMIDRMKADPDIARQASVVLPRMSFFLDGYTFDTARKVPKINRTNISQVKSNATFQYSPSPWDLHFSLWVYVKNVEDATKIVEQIVPFFGPDYTVRAFLIPGAPAVDIPIVLNEISHENLDSESFKDRSTLIWTLHFTMKANFWGPVVSQATINLANVSFFIGTPEVAANTPNIHSYALQEDIYKLVEVGNTEISGTLTFQPGLTANGEPTSNQAQSIPVANINWDDDWGIIEIMNGIQYS